MAGVKGRSGRKPKGWIRPGAEIPAAVDGETDQPVVQIEGDAPVPAQATPLALLEAIMNDLRLPIKERMRAAIAAAQYRHVKRGEGGKKEEAGQKAKQAGAGRFSSSEPPRLVAAGGKRTG